LRREPIPDTHNGKGVALLSGGTSKRDQEKTLLRWANNNNNNNRLLLKRNGFAHTKWHMTPVFHLSNYAVSVRTYTNFSNIFLNPVKHNKNIISYIKRRFWLIDWCLRKPTWHNSQNKNKPEKEVYQPSTCSSVSLSTAEGGWFHILNLQMS